MTARKVGVSSQRCARDGPDDITLLHHFLSLGASLELDSEGVRWSPLHFAVSYGKAGVLRELLRLGVPMDITEGANQTPLRYALQYPERGMLAGVA